MTRVTLRPARTSDLAFCIDRPLPHRIRAITAVIGERVIGIGGLGYRTDGTVIAFAHFSDEMRKYPAAVHRAGKMGMRLIRASGAPLVIAEAQPGNPAAARWLTHFGFVPTLICGQAAFVWRREVDQHAG